MEGKRGGKKIIYRLRLSATPLNTVSIISCLYIVYPILSKRIYTCIHITYIYFILLHACFQDV